MQGALTGSLSLVDVSGYVIIGAIVALMVASIITTFVVHARYYRIDRELYNASEESGIFHAPVLSHILREATAANRRRAGEINSQAIIEQAFQSHLKGMLVAERFVRASTGLLIVLGLVGTFYGLTLSIGKLVLLISGDSKGAVEVTESLTRGLTEALSGMSVAFSTSLFGILAAIVLTLVGVFFNVADRRSALMVRIESYIDNFANTAKAPAQEGAGFAMPGGVMNAQLAAGLNGAVGELKNAVAQFDAALQRFATNTRDFQEFNHHLKDNVQRMSLSFGDLSETLKQSLNALRQR